jgi:hypothetical protein
MMGASLGVGDHKGYQGLFGFESGTLCLALALEKAIPAGIICCVLGTRDSGRV